jgi:spermidine synthase
MTPKFWQLWLSYLYPMPFEQTSSDFNPVLEVSLHRGQWALYANNAIYSWGRHYDNFRTAFERMDFSKLPGNEVLVLGLGLGSVPLLLEKHFNKQLAYTAVEIDPKVVELAEKYVLSDLKSPFDVICGDAEIFLDATDFPYDLICFDIFEDSVVPEAFQSDACFERLAELIAPGGLLLYNLMSLTAADQRNSARLLVTAQKYFPDACLMSTNTNTILFSDRHYLVG